MVSDYLDDAQIAKGKMAGVSGSFCLAKWKQTSLHLTTGHTNSCYHPPLHKIPVESLADNPSALHNTEHKKERRKEMVDPFTKVKHSECNYCWNIEKQGNMSDRHYRSGEPWAMQSFDDIVANPLVDHNPSYVEVNFNHACNLKCSYCSPQFSSTWEQEVKELGAYPTNTPHNDPAHFTGDRRPIPNREHNPYREAFWRWWPDLYKELEHFRMTGGEPLMDKNTYKAFDYVLENPKPNLHLNVTSNFSVEEKLWVKYLDYVKRLCDGSIEHFMQYVSVDTWGKQAEYIRDGLDFNLMWDRVNQFLEEVPYYSSLTFIITMNNLAITGMQKLLEEIKQLRDNYSKTYQRVWFDTPVLRSPQWQSMQILSEPYVMKLEQCKQYMEDNIETEETRFHGFKDYEIQRMGRDIAWMAERLADEYIQEQKADFYRFFNEHDKRRNTNFLEVFPEMSSWWKECGYYATQG